MKKGLAILALAMVVPGVAEGQIVINEVAWMGTIVDSVDPGQWWRYEWVELQNQDAGSVNLNGWRVEVWGDELEYQIPLSGSMSPDGYYLVASSDKIAGYDLNYANLGGRMRNTGSLIILKDALGNVADEVDARGGWPAGDNEGKLTMARGEDGSWKTSYDVGGTPGKENRVLDSETAPTQKRPDSASLNFSSLSVALPLAFFSGIFVLVLRRRLATKA